MEDTEVEEGEACYFKDDSNIDPDIALLTLKKVQFVFTWLRVYPIVSQSQSDVLVRYNVKIRAMGNVAVKDEKLQNVLGHFQKDFEGGVSAENLGAKFGGYGSFLPTYQRSPSVRPQPKTPQRVQNLSSPKSPNVLPVEGGSNSSTAPSDAARFLRIGNASSGLPSLHSARALPAYVSSKQDSCLSSAQVNEKFPLKLEPVSNKPAKQDSCLSSGRVIEKFPTRHESVSNKSVNPTDHRTLKVRIKVGSDNKARKNAAIYSGLGLISPSSSMGNSPSLEEGGEMPSECQIAPEESPNSILRVMTCFPVPGGLLLSPLHESLLCLERKEKLSQNSALVPAVKCDVEHSAVFANDPASLVGNKKAPKAKKTKILAKSHDLELLKQDIRANFDDKESTIEKLEVARNLESEIQGWKQGLSNKTKLKPLSNFVCHVVEVDKGGIEDKSATGLGKEFSESISDQEGGEYEKAEAGSSSIEKICESRLKTSLLDISTDRRENVKSRCNKVSAPFNADADVSTSKRDSNAGATGKSMQKVGQTAAYYEEDETRMPHGVGKSSVGGKCKSRGRKSSGKPSSEAEGGLMGEVHEVPKDKKKAGKMHSKSKLQNDNQKTRHNYKDVLPETRIEQINNQINTLERPFVDMEKDSNLQAVEKKHYALLDKQNEVSTVKRVDNLTSETILNEAANDVRPSAEGVTSEMEHTLVDPLVIEEDWVCCDRCEKWRLLPYGTKPDQLPEKWLCSMLNWLNGMNRCDISEEETTNALHALYQLPLPQSQNHLQNHVAGTAARAADACHFDQSHLNPSSHPMPNPRKKKQKSKGTPYAAINGGRVQISGYTNNIQLEEMKRRHLNDTQKPTLESKLMSNSNVEHLSKSGNFPVNRIVHKQKEKHAISGDSKLKTKREADSYGYESTKKIKADVAFGTVKSWTAEHSGNIDKIAHGVESGLPSKPAVKRIGKHNEKGSSKDVKSVWDGKVRISSKKLRDCAPVSLQTGSFDMETFDERKIAPKKRKLKDWQEDQSYDETPRDNVSHVPDSNLFLKESSDIELGKGKKCRVSRTEGKESSTSKVDTRLNTKNKVTKIVLSGNKENLVQGREEVRKIEKDQQPRKYKIKVSSNKPASDEMDPLKRDLGSEQLSRTATSSSSKVSDSHKSRTHFPEVRGSPVESVSSSPMRTSSLAIARKDTLGNDAVRSGDFPGMDSPRKSFDGEANVESKQSGTARRGKVSGVFHSESLGFPMLDFRENNASQGFGEKCKSGVGHLANSDAVKSENPFPGDLQASDNFRTEDRVNMNHYDETAIFDVKSTKGSSLLSKDMVRTSANDFQRVKLKVSDPPREMEPLNLKHSLKDEVETGVQNVALLHEGSNDFNHRIKPVNHERSGLRGSDGEDAKRSDPSQVELRGGKSQAFQPHAHKQGNTFDVIPVGASSNDDLPKVVPNQCLFKDVPSTLRKDVSSQLASNALKEAEDLRCVADRLKDSEFGFECNEAYFQAALKFLHGASLLENCSGDGIKIAETSPMQIYSRCAKYCGDCALEYEKRREMAAAALAYKCMEVAYMKIVYCKNSSTNRDRHDLQTSLQMVPQGESPSSCVSDVDNLNNQAMVDKTAISKGVVPHAGNHAIVAHNQLNFVRLLDFTKDVNSAMEASRKSQAAFAAANVLLEEAQNKEGIVSVKRVIDFSFQDIEELLRLVRHAIGAISCQGLGGSKD